MSNMIDKSLLQQVFNSNEFKAWLISKRWFGDKSSLSTLDFTVIINYFQILSDNIFLIIIKITTAEYSKEYFLPLIRYEKIQEILEPKENKRDLIVTLTEKTFSKIIALNTSDDIVDSVLSLNLLEAEYCAIFWKKLLFDKKISELFPSMNLELKLYDDQFENEEHLKKARSLIEAGLYPEKYDLSLELLGGGNTTNMLFLLRIYNKKTPDQKPDSYVLKSYKVYAERIEPRTLYVLVKNNFPNAPKIYGMVDINGKETIGILENVPNIGNLGDIYWNELNQMVKSLFIDIEGNYSHLTNKETINKVIKEYCGESLKVSEEIGIQIKNLHKALILKGDSQYFEETVNSEEYLLDYTNKLNKMVSEIQQNIKKNTDRAFYTSPKISSILIDIRDIIERYRSEFEIKQFKIQPVHQDLHMQQILFNKVNDHFNFYFIDFEGDPQLSIEEKKSRFPIEKDLGSFLRSLSYIKFNTLLNFIGEKIIDKNKFEVPEEFLFSIYFRKSAKITKEQKILEILLNLLNSWEKKLMSKIFNPSLKLHFTLIKYYTIERALHELDYELLFRPNNIIIPILGLKEIIDKN
ncbi:MAG: hypothetical protein MUP85_08890 [Candidatus Lokiarchaeota archaeon]|nr:hypothetical protein [Candidatus Lokiarchaeota archaeon]